MKDLIKEILEDFEYKGTPCDKDDCLLIKGQYYFKSKFSGCDFTINAEHEDGNVVDILVWFEKTRDNIPEGLEGVIESMVIVLIREGFEAWYRGYKNK